MDSRRFVVSSAASCLLSWRLAVFIFHSGVLGGCPLGLLAACARVSSTFWWGIRASCVPVASTQRADLAAALPEPRALRQAAGGSF